MDIKKVLKNGILFAILFAPLSSIALFDFGRDRYYDDPYYYDRPHLFGRRGYYYDSRVREARDLERADRLEKAAELREKEAVLREKEAALREREAKLLEKKAEIKMRANNGYKPQVK